MRLVDLDPHWVAINRWDSSDGTQHYSDGRRGGISFYCPVHTEKCKCCNQFLPKTHRLVVFFSNPVDGLPPQYGIEHLWIRTREEFNNLTLTPSIDASKYVVDGTICWHGHITNGEIK